MLRFILGRLWVMLLTMIALTMIVFYLVNLPPNLEKVAKTQGSIRMTQPEVELWLDQHGFGGPVYERYFTWLGNLPKGDMGVSFRFQQPVSTIIAERAWYTGILMFWVMVVMVPGALLIGILAGMREGSTLDRGLSVASIASTSAPEYVTGIIFTAIFASSLGWFKGIASVQNITFENFTLPVATMAIYGMGYIARMTRASMAEVMTSQYIRTARLKGLSFRRVVLRHALRNALIAPFTVIMLQFPWLLTGVVIVEAMFNYKGFGWTLVNAAENNDIDLLLACSIVAVVVVLLTQLISDIGYPWLNPRIRVQ